MRNSPVTRTESELLREEIKKLQRRVLQLENQHTPTVPVYRPDFPDDAVTGQVALADNPDDELALFWRNASEWLGALLSYVFENTGEWLIIKGTGAYPGSFPVGGQTAGWSVGIDGLTVGVGASGAFASLILSSENTATLRSDGQVNITAVADIVATSDTTTNNVTDFFDVNAGNSVTVTAQNGGGTGEVNIDPDKLSFFGVPAVAQQATPVTLGDVIALLQAYGLAA